MTASTTDWRKLHAFGLPGGSIRALLALAVFGAIWVLLLSDERGVPDYLRNLMFIILGHYFAARGQPASGDGDPGPPPLYLPRGMMRMIFLGGFVVVGVLMAQRDRVFEPGGDALSAGALTLVLVAGFLIGVVTSRIRAWRIRRGHQPRRIFEDLRAIIALTAATALVFAVFDVISLPDQGFARFLGGEEVLAAVVGFYFGSRS
jgi:hypothetical protein